MSDLRERLRSSAVVIAHLPEDPGYNGSRLIIDDIEAERIAKDLDDAVARISTLEAALASRDEIRREALREAAAHLNHKAFLCHAHDDFGKGRERGFLDSEKEVLALAEKEGAGRGLAEKP